MSLVNPENVHLALPGVQYAYPFFYIISTADPESDRVSLPLLTAVVVKKVIKTCKVIVGVVNRILLRGIEVIDVNGQVFIFSKA